VKDFLDKIKDKKVLLLDGAWGTMLFEKGLSAGECPELWNMNKRDTVLDIAKSYIEAGSDIIETNSFGASGMKLELFGLADKATAINKEAALISREAAGDDKFVFGAVGPTGKILMMGEVTEEQVFKTFCEHMQALEKGGVDAIIVETMTALDEAVLAIKAAKESTNLPVICTFTFDKVADNTYRTMMGVSPKEMALTLINEGADMIGTNCGNGFDDLIDIGKEIRQDYSEFPLLVQANAGIPKFIDGQNLFPDSPESMAAKIPQLMNLGVNIIGGCCGTSPEHISQFAKFIH